MNTFVITTFIGQYTGSNKFGNKSSYDEFAITASRFSIFMNASLWYYIMTNIKKAPEGTSRQAQGTRGHKPSPSLQKQVLITKFIMLKRKGENLLHFHKIIYYTIKKSNLFVGLMEKSVLSVKCVFFFL